MPRWLDELHEDLERLDAAFLRRQLVPIDRVETGNSPMLASGCRIERGGKTLINFASNDYLALSDHPHLKQAASQATMDWGTGSGASRLVTGHLSIHAQVERRFAAFKHAEAALLCATGYLANLAVLSTLARPGDLICIDKLCHASLIDAAQGSGATVRVFPHLQLGKLERLLEGPMRQVQQSEKESSPRKFIVTDSIFSMDGDAADLVALCDLAEKHEAILIVDEAHATGLLGASGAGLCEAQCVADRVDIVISTASKALGGLGGIITAKQVVIDTLINHARSFIYTTAVPASQAATIAAALDVVRDEPWRRERVLALTASVHDMLRASKFAPAFPFTGPPCSPIVPIITGSPAAALALASHLAEQGIHAPAIRPPPWHPMQRGFA